MRFIYLKMGSSIFMYRTNKRVILVGILLLISIVTASSMVVLPPCFTSNMVLQQQTQAALWGTAQANVQLKISTSWNHKTYQLKVPFSGHWDLKVITPVAGGPYSISFNDGQLKVLSNILIGEVWICSGQSNMELPLAGWGKVTNYKAEIAAANFPQIRLLTVNRSTSDVPVDTFGVKSGGWQICSSQTIAEFSATAFFFGRNLFQDKHIPIGLIHTSWGGTVAEAWTSATTLKKIPEFASVIATHEKNLSIAVKKTEKPPSNLDVWTKLMNSLDSGYQSNVPVYAATGLETSSWKTMQIPTYWESAGLPAYDGIVWFRKKVIIPASQAGKDLILSLGLVDDNDITWFNGEEVGRTEGYTVSREYKIPGKVVKEGENIIAVRITDTGGGGGIYGNASAIQLKGQGGFFISLAGQWIYRPGISASGKPVPLPVENPNIPAVLFNAMINPIIPFTMRGVIWYQGESNADRAYQYRTLFPAMIQDWRSHWKMGNFPFLYVQLANFMDTSAHPEESAWAELREAQTKTLASPNTGMAVIIDIGEAKDIHPKNKQDVGYRLSLIARAQVYKEKIEDSGPVLSKFIKAKNKLILSFTHTTGGLRTRNNQELNGFAIAGKDHKYYWAKAKIAGNSVILSSVEVGLPEAVRYGWANNPVCNLMNGKKLPASPFRTDQYTEITRK